MNKQTFITQLKRELEPLKQGTKLEILADIEEHFVNGEASGKTQEQLAEELGSPKELAADYIEEASAAEKKDVVVGNVGRSVLAAFGLLLLDVMIMIPIIASLFAVLLSLWTVPLSLFAVSLALFILPITASVPSWLFIVAAIALIGLSVAMAVGLIYLSKYFVKMVAAYGKAHYNIIKGGISK